VRTTVVLDEKKVKAAKRAFDIATTKDLTDFALSKLLRAHNRMGILALKGKVKIDIDLDQSRETS
jgi:hypothetical protein